MDNIFSRGVKLAFGALPDKAKKKARKILQERILKGGNLVSDEHFEARTNFCKTRLAGRQCEYFGPVFPGGVEFKEGCQACNCPMITKARMESITDPVMAQVFQGGQTEIICKHPEGNLWAEIDEQFKVKK